MQDCFRLHPEMYASELDDDEDEVEEELRARAAAESGEVPSSEGVLANKSINSPHTTETSPETKKAGEPSNHESSGTTAAASADPAAEDNKELVPKATHDATST